MILQDKFYKSTEVAEILGVSLRTLYRYMESEKIHSVHLPSGRHRFTKQQVEEFLYSNSFEPEPQEEIPRQYRQPNPSSFQNYQRPIKPLEVKEQPYTQAYNEQPVTQNIKRETTIPTDEELDKQLDDLLNSLGSEEPKIKDEVVNSTKADIDFRQNSYTPAPTYTPQPIKPEPKPEIIENAYNDRDEDELDKLLRSLEEEEEEKPVVDTSYSSNKSFTSLSDNGFDGFRIKPQDQPLDENKVIYFYCPHNDLRTVAKIIKKVGEDNGLKYAFTLNAGASLFFPLDPFSIIHFYVHKNDLEIWKKELQLKESSETEANLGILLSTGRAFNNLSEVSGLKVASKEVLIDNLRSHSLIQLARQVEDQL